MVLQRWLWRWAPVLIVVPLPPLLRRLGEAWAGVSGPDLELTTPFWTRFAIMAVQFLIPAALALLCLRVGRWFAPHRPAPTPRDWWLPVAVMAVPVMELLTIFAAQFGRLLRLVAHLPAPPVWPPRPYTSALDYLWLLFPLLAAPVAEELLHRVFLFSALVPRFGRLGAYIIAAVLFGWVHADPFAPMGTALGLCLLWEITGRPAAVITAHVLFNLVAVIDARGSAGHYIAVALLGAPMFWLISGSWVREIWQRAKAPPAA